MLGALADGPLGVTEVADRAGPAEVDRRAAAGHARARGRRRAGPGRHALPARAAARDARGRAHAGPVAGRRRATRLDRAGRGGRARRPGLSVPDGDLVHYIDQVDTPNPVSVRDWTGLARAAARRLVRPGAARVPAAGRARALPRAAARAVHAADAHRPRRRSASACARSGATATRGSLEEFDEGISSVAAPDRRRVGRGRRGGPPPRAVVPLPGRRDGGGRRRARRRGGRPDRGDWSGSRAEAVGPTVARRGSVRGGGGGRWGRAEPGVAGPTGSRSMVRTWRVLPLSVRTSAAGDHAGREPLDDRDLAAVEAGAA